MARGTAELFRGSLASARRAFSLGPPIVGVRQAMLGSPVGGAIGHEKTRPFDRVFRERDLRVARGRTTNRSDQRAFLRPVAALAAFSTSAFTVSAAVSNWALARLAMAS